MVIKDLDYIENERAEAEREKMKENIASDVGDVLNRIRNNRKPKKKKSLLGTIIKTLAIIGLLILVINFALANIWLLRFFIKSIFGV